MTFAQSTWSIGDWELLWGAPQWIPAAIAIAILMTVAVIWAYAIPWVRPSIKVLAATLKIAAVILLAICLLQPLRSGTRPRPQANVMPIVVDNSQSMRLKPDGEESRFESIAPLLDETTSWRVRLAQDFDVRQYAFDARLQNVDSFDELTADGYVSSLSGSLRSLADRFGQRPVAGVVLFTDGNLTDPPTADFDWSSLGFPVYPVLADDSATARDLRVKDISVRQTDFESAPITLTVSLDAVSMSDEDVIVQLQDRATEKVVEERKLKLGRSGESQEVRFRFRPEESGVLFYRISVFTPADRQAVAAAASADSESATLAERESDEATLLNNTRLVTIDRGLGPYRILYVAGRPNWEYKFLRRALQVDAEVQLVGLLRIAKSEPKFSFRDKEVSDTNPLFAGLGADEEETAEQYDEPVIIRLGVKESEELSDGFPESAEELFAYHAVILDDIESDFFKQDQMLLLRRFVSARGGGLLLLGGQESFDDRTFADTPLAELSPVYAPRSSQTGIEGPFRMRLTREGLLQPWVRLRDNEVAERNRLEEMPPFLTANRVGDVKPGATQLSIIESVDGQTRHPALIAQRFGKGRTAALTVGDLWRWSMHRDEKTDDDPGQAWRQIAHWLVNDVPRRADVRVETSRDPSQPVRIVATARDEAFLPMDNAKVDLMVTPPSGKPIPLTVNMDDQQPGVYEAAYWSREPGAYRVEAKIAAPDGSRVGQAAAGWTAQSGTVEFNQLQVDRDLLNEIASQTGGEVVAAGRLDQFVRDLSARDVPVTETWVYPIWHRPWVLFAAIVCLCGEWGLRRWKGLA